MGTTGSLFPFCTFRASCSKNCPSCSFCLKVCLLILNTDFVHNVIYNIKILNIELCDTSFLYC